MARLCAGFGRKKEKKGFFDWYFNSRKAKEPPVMARTTPMRIEPKTFFANERTFLSWLHMAVTIGSIAAALLGFVGVADSSKHKQQVRTALRAILPPCSEAPHRCHTCGKITPTGLHISHLRLLIVFNMREAPTQSPDKLSITAGFRLSLVDGTSGQCLHNHIIACAI